MGNAMRALLILLAFTQHYLLMGPIQDAVVSGDFSPFRDVCSERVSVNMEEPLALRGNFEKNRFIKNMTAGFSEFKVVSMEWISKHIWEDYAVQSLNLRMKNIRNGRDEVYKLIFFMKREQKEWTLYYLRGIRL